MKQKRWVSWEAVSSLPQVKKISLEAQHSTNLATIEKHNGLLVECLVVRGQSRNHVLFEDAARRIPAYARLHELIKAKAFDVLVFLDRSRLGRTAPLSMAVIGLCQEAGILCYDLESPPASLEIPEDPNYDDALIGAIKSTNYQRELVKIQYRHRTGMLDRTQKGKFAGRVPWGWIQQWHPDGEHYDILIDESVAEIIRLCFPYLYIEQGMGLGNMAAELNRRGYLSAKMRPFTYASVESMLLMIFRYAGIVEINKDSAKRPYLRAKGEFPAIITEEVAQAVEDERLRRLGSRRPRNQLSRFSGVVYCAVCNEPMYYTRGQHKRDSGNTYPTVSLRCPNKHPHRELVESKIYEALRTTFDNLHSGILEFTIEEEEETGDKAGDRTERATAEIERLKASQEALDRRHFVEGKIPLTVYEKLSAEISERIAGLTMEIANLQDEAKQAVEQAKRAERFEIVKRSGLEWLDDPNMAASNSWLRRCVRVYVRNNQVESVILL